jgi:hypothetical protein
MILGGVAALVGVVLWANPPLAPRAPACAGGVPQSIYVWQRAWTDSVREAVVKRAPETAGVVALAAEIAWKKGRMEAAEVGWDAEALRDSCVPVGLALRIGPCDAATMRDPGTVRALVLHARRIVELAEHRGLDLSELQIDFDSATSRLGDYAAWVREIATAVRPVPVTITTLPSWMGSDAFGPLVRETAGFVLQVHSVDKARMEDHDPSLCDAERARAWIEQAARFGVPFQVALPTYGYVALFDDRGSLRGLVAEAQVAVPTAAAKAREVRSDPVAMATLVRELRDSRPALMRGVIWYRLPVDGDRMNWSWPTLQRVARGEIPEPRLEFQPARDGSGLIEVEARNDGDGDARMPGAITVRWKGPGRLVAADGVMGMETERGQAAVTFRSSADAALGRLRPGERRRLGWLRLERDMEVAIDVQ